MISATSAAKLHCPVVKVTQNTFDMDQFTYYVANHVCEKQDKKYGVFYDWACELVAICEFSGIATFVLAVHFTATDKLPPIGLRSNTQRTSGAPSPPGNYDCINCSSNLDCVFHRKHYHCCSMFTWDVVSGEWSVLDYGELVEMGPKWRSQSTKKQTTFLRAKAWKLTEQLRGGGTDEQERPADRHLRVLDSCNVKSKAAVTDLRNGVEFYRGSAAETGFHDLSDFNSSEEEVDEDEDDEFI